MWKTAEKRQPKHQFQACLERQGLLALELGNNKKLNSYFAINDLHICINQCEEMLPP
jgi:hypothetical protein